MIKRIVVFIASFMVFFMGFGPFLMAQASQTPTVEMADKMRSEGKIYVVILVIAIVFTGLWLFTLFTERRVSRLEKEINSLKSMND